MTEEQQKQLGQILWGIANDLRGSMDPIEFKDYMLSFIFLKNLSENYEKKAQEKLKKDYLEPTESENPLQVFYRMHPDKVRKFEDAMDKALGYIIEPNFLWSNISRLAKQQNKRTLETLANCLKHIERDTFKGEFEGFFESVRLESTSLGKSHIKRNEKICDVIMSIDVHMKKFPKDQDTLGNAYEYLIGEFAAGSGKKAGEFYTPQQCSTILSRIVSLDSQDPTKGEKSSIKNILDMACGSGSLLLNVNREMHDRVDEKIYGQESNRVTSNLAKMNMLLHGVKIPKFDIHYGNTLENDWNILNDPNPSKKMEFEAVVANPPFSQKWKHSDKLKEDIRFSNYGLAPQSAADFAFLLHGFHYLSQDGTMAIIMPHGVLFRGGAEAKIREKLLKDNNIDAIIGLPANLFFAVAIPVCIIVLKKCKKDKDVLIIDASQKFNKERKQNILSKQHIKDIIDEYQHRKEKDKKYSRKVPISEIAENDYNLNIPQYIDNFEEEVIEDLEELITEADSLESEWKKIKLQTKKHLKGIRNE